MIVSAASFDVVPVAPFAGAWIEMSSTLVFSVAPVLSLPSRERGLKFTVDAMNTAEHLSLPSRERGLKSACRVPFFRFFGSLPSRERGLKFTYHNINKTDRSRSLRGSVD